MRVTNTEFTIFLELNMESGIPYLLQYSSLLVFSPQSKGTFTQVCEYQEEDVQSRTFQRLPIMPNKENEKIMGKFMNLDAKILNEIIAIRLYQCFKVVLYPNQIRLVQEYKGGVKFEKRC